MCDGVFRPVYLTLVVVGFVATQSEIFAFLEIKGYCDIVSTLRLNNPSICDHTDIEIK